MDAGPKPIGLICPLAAPHLETGADALTHGWVQARLPKNNIPLPNSFWVHYDKTSWEIFWTVVECVFLIWNLVKNTNAFNIFCGPFILSLGSLCVTSLELGLAVWGWIALVWHYEFSVISSVGSLWGWSLIMHNVLGNENPKNNKTKVFPIF